MKTVNGNMSIKQVLKTYPFVLDEFKRVGLGKFADEQILEKLGSLLKLQTALTSLNIDEEAFVAKLNTLIQEQEGKESFSLADNPEQQRDLTLLALLPCGMKVPFTRAFEEFIREYNKTHNNECKFLIEGNVNHEVSYYPYIDSVKSSDELPDIIITSDINSFYHGYFKEHFLDTKTFVDVSLTDMPDKFTKAQYKDPSGQFTMLSANMLVLVAIDELLGELDKPASLEDLLKPEYENKLVIRGEEEFFCNAVLLPFYKLYGEESIVNIARSVVTGLHPSEMIKMIDSKKSDVAPLYIMPYFFAQKIKHKERISIIEPKEGAVVSPVQMLVKKDSADRLKEVTDFFCGSDLGKIYADAYFPSTNSSVDNSAVKLDSYFWLGWDYIYSQDIGAVKKRIDALFKSEYLKVGSAV